MKNMNTEMLKAQNYMIFRDMKVQVIRSNRKTIGLEVRADESVILRAPQWLSEKKLDEWIGEHAYWIEEKVKQMRQRNSNKKLTGAPAVDEISDVEWKSILGEFTERVNHFCKIMDVTVGRITIRNQKTRWGSCSSKGNVNFNYQLYYMPRELMDYVIIHELSHRRHMNHSAEFWREVEKYCPAYRECRKKLRNYEITP